MTRGLYGWRPSQGGAARTFLKEREAEVAIERAAAAANERITESRNWLASYKGQSRFNWSGKFPVTITKEDEHHDEIEEAPGQEHLREGLGDATQECSASSLARGEDGTGDFRG